MIKGALAGAAVIWGRSVHLGRIGEATTDAALIAERMRSALLSAAGAPAVLPTDCSDRNRVGDLTATFGWNPGLNATIIGTAESSVARAKQATIQQAAVKRQLEKLLSHTLFARSERMGRFLKLAVE